MRIVRTIAVLSALSALGSPRAVAQPGAPLGTAQLQISGARLTLYSDTLTTDAEQTINVGEAVRVRTCYGSGAACGTAAPGAVPGLKVVGDLSGPELPQAIPYETAPGGTFFLPGFQREGDYLLSNIRLVETTTGRVLANAEPSLATLHVRQILLASATVTRLTLADLQARGITITQQNFNAFKFAVGFVFSGTTVIIELPVLYTGNGLAQMLDKPEVKLDGLPPAVASAVKRWQPPSITPFQLNATGPRDPKPGGGDDEITDPEFPLYGAIVLPGNVSFLNQFFDAKLIVASGAPNGSGVTLQNVTGALRLPSGEVLRLAGTSPPVAAGQKLPVLKANGQGALGPGEQGTASWTVEGLLPGTHVLRMDIEADLARPGRPDLATGGVVQAAVEVVDARFQLAFNHPDVVRTGEPYSLYVTVTNLSRAAQNLVTLDLASENISGAHKADAQESFAKTIQTLAPGASETLEYRLVADVTGTCVATTFQATGGLTGVIHLRAGVGEAGIPLSPAALILPRFTNLLPKSLVDGDVRLLGLAYSLATAPAGATPPGLPHPLKSDVERRAIDLGEAGQRLYLQEKLLETLEALALDQLGNRHDLPEYDALRRALDRGAQASTALGDLFRQEQQNRNLPAADFVDHFATSVSYGRPWMSAVLIPNGSQPAPTLEVRQISGAGTTYLAYTSEDPARLRSLPFGEIYAIHDVPGGAKVPFALVGQLDATASYRIDLHAPATGASGRLILVVPSDDLSSFRKVDFGFMSMNANEVWEVRAVKTAGDAPLTFGLTFAGSGAPVPGAPPPSITNLSLPPFRVIGAVQDPELDRYGLGISYLFNRPPDKASAETPSSYPVRSTFHGQDTSSPAVTVDRVATKAGAAAYWQPNSERVVNVRYDSPISALNGIFENVPVMRHEHLLVTNAIRDGHGTPLDPQVPPIVIDPNRTGGLVDGKVLRGDGTPAAGTRVQLLRYRVITSPGAPEGKLVVDVVAEAVTGADGAFYFDFIEEPPPPGRTLGSPPNEMTEQVQSGFLLRATVPPGADPVLQPEEREEISTTIRLQNRLLHVNIALLGRGTVKGRLVYADNGAPVTDGTVAAASTLFPEQRTVVPAADGSFTLGGLPVGPITLSGRDGAGNRVYQTVGIQKPGDIVNVTLQLGRTGPPKTGTVTVKIMRLRSGSPRPPPVPSPGANVAVYSNGSYIASKTSDNLGNATFTGVPVGKVTLQAADFSVSRTPALTDLTLAADATVLATLTLSDAAPRSVVGRVLFHDGPTNTNLPVSGAVAFIQGPGSFAYTDATGTYRIDGVPVQGVGDPAYTVTAFDTVRGLQGQTALPPILDSGDGSPILAADIVLKSMTGGIDGVVLDPLGRTAAGIAVTLGFDDQGNEIAMNSRGDGRFSFDNIAVGSRPVFAHVGDGLVAGKVGYFGQTTATIVFGGHRPFVTIRMAGSGVVNVRTHTSASAGVLSPINYRPTAYDSSAAIGPLANPIQTTTDQDGRLTLVLPVGRFSLTAINPLNGNKSVNSSIDYAGQVINLDIVFDTASTVTGHVVGLDGVTPVPNADVSFSASGLLPQTQRTDGQGAFRYELVPQGHVSVTAAALVGSVDRVGRADGYITGPGQTLDLTVVMKAQGTVRGQIVDLVGSLAAPLAFAQYYVQESAYPNRRLPAGTGFYSADAQGQYEVSHVFAGLVTVVARDRNQVTRQGSARGEITADFQVLTLPDVVMSTSVGVLGVTVRDPDSGGPVADAVLTLSNGDVAVADANGQASFDALPLGTYSVHAFHAPTGRAGLTSGLRLQNAGDRVDAVVVLDTRGQVGGTLWDDAAKTVAVGAGTVELKGFTNGRSWGTSIRALATTSSDAGSLGRFLFDGIPPGSYTLGAGVSTSPRRAAASLSTTPTAPVVSIDLVLEPVADRFVRLFENLTAGVSEVDPANGIYALTLIQPWGCPPGCTYSFTAASPSSAYPGHLYRFPNVLTAQSLSVTAQESSGNQRKGSISGTGAFAGAGTSSDPYRLVLRAKGRVTVTVRDALGQPAQANVAIDSAGGHYEAATDGSGLATFDAVLSGTVYASARVSATGFGGTATGTLQFDDQTLALAITLAPAVSAHGVVYHAPPGDVWNGDVGTLSPESGAIVQIRDSGGQLQIVTTSADGAYRFAVLRTGAYTISATDALVVALTSGSGTLVGPNGNDNALPPLVLDASRPTIVSIVPPPGSVGISRNAPVEITFSEPLLDAVLPSGGPTSPYFTLRSATGLQPAGAWTASLNASGQQVVRFTPAGLYDNSTVHSLTITGGPSGVRDRAGRPVTDSGDVGSNFTTSDTVGPVVTGSVPSLDRPVDPVAPIRFDFSEVVTATAQELDGSGPTPAAQLFWQQNASSDWQPVPITMFLSRGGYSLVIQPPTGVTYLNDSLRRRVHLSRLRDATGNLMADYDKAFRIYDQNPPHVDVAFPPGASAGQLVGGSSYTLTPSLSNLDDLPQGDADRVEYFLASSGDPSTPASTAAFTARVSPFAWTFVAAYVGNGVDPRLFPVWVKAIDTSANASNVVKLAMAVLPNAPPLIASVAAAATAPVAGTFYAGSSLAATVAGVADPDGASVTLTAELRKNNPGSPNDPADLVASLPSQALTRPAAGWPALAPPVFATAIPIATADGTSLFFRVKAIDALGASATAESARFAVAHDPNPPVVDSLVARLSGASPTASQFFIGQKLVLEFRARDAETAVRTTSLALFGVFASPQAATLVGGTTNLYRTAELTVPATVPPGGLSVTATASATDWGGNTGTLPLAFNVSPTPDPYAPVVTWLTPWEGGAWPAGYTSTVSPQGAALLLRVRATDLDRVANSDVPGTLASVQFKGPVDAAGTLAAAFVDGVLVAGTDGPGTGVYEALWRVPNGVAPGTQIPFQVRVVDAGANATTVEAHLRAAQPRKVYEAAQVAVLPGDAMLGAGGAAAGPVFLLDGTVLSLYPQTSPAVRALPAMYVYAGGVAAGATFTPSPSVLTAPEITSYASSILYNPLELAVTDAFGLGHGARVDMAAKGLLGSTPTQSMILPGQTGAQQYAGGSHGGSGTPGSYYARTDPYPAGSVYDAIKDPALPGGGGGYATSMYGATAAGGTGGGVVRLLAPGATLHLAGDILATGGDGNSYSAPGGAGGAVRVVASRIEGAGTVSASGGRGTSGTSTGGGGGGRIALSFADPPAASLALVLRATGGVDALGDGGAYQRAGAGTIYVEETDALGVPKAPGRLIVTNGSGKPAWPTPFSGPQRFGAVEAHGAARLVFDDDLSVGPMDPGTLNDRASLSLDSEARAELRSDVPQVALTAVPDGGDVKTNQALSVTYTASGPIGLAAVTRSFSPTAASTTAFYNEPLSITQGAQPLVVNVPASQLPGPITYTLTAADRAGRSAKVVKTWNVLADSPPSLVLSGVTPGPSVLPGTTLTATATASDDVSVASVVLTLAGAASMTITRTVNAPSTVQVLSLTLPVTLTAGQVVTLQVDAYDSFGHKTSAAPVVYSIIADAVPPAITAVTLAPVKAGDVYTTGDVVTFTVTATDNVAIATIRLTIDGQTTPFSASPAVLAWTAPNVAGPTPYTLDVEAFDVAGNRTTASRSLSVIPAGGGTFPVVSFTCPTTGAYLPSAYAGLLLSAAATDSGGITKIEFFRPGDTTPFDTLTATGAPSSYSGTSAAITIPTVTVDTIVRYRARAWNPSNNFSEVFVDVHVVPAVDVAIAGAADFAVLRTGTLVIDTPRTWAGLIVLRGATITHTAYAGSASTNAVNLTATGAIYVECGGSIDVSGRGYPAGVSYPGAVVPGSYASGSHIGYGGLGSGGLSTLPLGSTFGSVYRPQEAGGGGRFFGVGGGIVRISGASVSLDGAIRANGVPTGYSNYNVTAAGAGGSVWVTAGALGGAGVVEARGGDAESSGGGGAIAFEYISTTSTVLANLLARGGGSGSATTNAGTGTIWVKGPSSTYGDATIDNKGIVGQATELPSLGSGVALAGSAGATLVTDRAVNVPAYFAGLFVEISDASSVLKGTCQVSTAAGGIINKTVTLVSCSPALSVAPNDGWQGVYHFDTLKAPNGEAITSVDPIRLGLNGVFTLAGPTAAGKYLEFPYGFTGTDVKVTGNVSLPSITATNLTVKAGAILTHPTTVGSNAQSLTLAVTNTVAIEAGATIDVSGRGYPMGVSYPGVVVPGSVSGGSHMGYGGLYNAPLGSTFGSVYRPSEAGGGGSASGGVGGGIVKVSAGSVSLDGAIRANGVTTAPGDRAGAGGSVWLMIGALSGAGVVEARGADSTGAQYSHGGGGAIAVEYVSTTGTVLANLLARGGGSGSATRNGGAGTIWVKGPTSTYGGMTIDNKGISGQTTELPPLGSGTAQAGSAGATLVTDRAVNIPSYFAGHWVEISDSTNVLKGTCQISTALGGIVNKTATLVSCSPALSLTVGDRWRGVYRFDNASVLGNAALRSADPIVAPGFDRPTGTLQFGAGQASSVLAGSTVNLTLAATDSTGLTSVTLRAGGPVTSGSVSQSKSTGNVTTYSTTFQVTLLQTAAAGDTVTLIADMYNKLGTVTTTLSLVVTVIADSQAPTINSVTFTPPGGATYPGGTKLTIDVDASDNVGVKNVTMTVQGVDTVLSTAPYRFTWTAPAVTVATPIDLTFKATDNAGNVSTVTKPLTITRTDSGTLPVVSWTCPSGDQTVPAGYTIQLGARATDDSGVIKIEFYRNAETVPIYIGNAPNYVTTPFTATTSVLLPGAPGPISFRVRAYDVGLRYTEAVVNLNMIAAVPINAASPDWAALATNVGVLSSGTLVIDQKRTLGGLMVLNGAVVTQPPISAGTEMVSLEVAGQVWVECGGAVDVSGSGYPVNKSYPGATTPGDSSGGSHMGYGGLHSAPLGTTFGSVYRPQEAGGGAGSGAAAYGDSGGGVVRIVSGALANDGAIRANGGQSTNRTGAGGSVWITTGVVRGAGVVEVHGGDNSVYYGGGGGGAIAIEYTSSSGTVLNNLLARTGTLSGAQGAAGTIWLKGPASTYGDLTVDNKGVAIQQATELPSLGSGVAQSGSAGATLATDRVVNIPAYFAGHFVEISDSSNAFKGTCQISTDPGGIINKTVTLVSCSPAFSLSQGDKWQGVYRFDNVTLSGARFLSVDPVRVPAVEARSAVEVRRIDTGALKVRAGASLSHLPTTDPLNPESIVINASGALTIEAGGSIDVSGRGYPVHTSYPGATTPPQSGTGTGGSHLGYGGLWIGSFGSTFGSVCRPQESGGGAGGPYFGEGGGIVRIVSGSLAADGAIRANGTSYQSSGAGGSVWITTGAVSGAGVVEVHGGNDVSYGSGGGGAIAIEYTSSSGTILNNLLARTGSPSSNFRYGGAGTVYLKGPASTFGGLTVDNGGKPGQATELPSLGSGVAQAGSTGATLVSDRAVNVPVYFAGHWVEVRDSTGATLKGAWRISTAAGGIVNKTVTLVPNGAETISVVPGDKWQGVYRFDTAPSVTGGATLTSVDPVRVGGSLLRAEPVAAATAPAPFAIRSVSLCTGFAASLKPGSSLVVCADTDARDVTLEISGAFEARIAAYGNCRDPITIPGSAKPGPLTIVATARDAEGRTASAAIHGLVVADELAPVLVSVEPAPAAVFRSGDPLRVAVEAWDDVGIASVAITLGTQRTILTAPPFEIRALAPPVAAGESLPVVIEVFDPSGNVSRLVFDIGVLPAGTRPLSVAASAPAPGVSFEDGKLSVDGGWPWRDADGETRGRTLELPAIGAHAALAVDGAVVAVDGAVAQGAVHGGSVDVHRGGAFVGRFRILSVSEDGLVLRLEASAAGKVEKGDFLEGVWSFGELLLTRGARLIASDVVEAGIMSIDASSFFLSRNLQIPLQTEPARECPTRGPRPDPPGTAPAPAGGGAP